MAGGHCRSGIKMGQGELCLKSLLRSADFLINVGIFSYTEEGCESLSPRDKSTCALILFIVHNTLPKEIGCRERFFQK